MVESDFKQLEAVQAILAERALREKDAIKNYNSKIGIYTINRRDGTSEIIIGRSPQMVTAFYLTEIALEKKLDVLLLGETGTGKELIAQALHYNDSNRNNQNFEIVNCGLLSKELLRSELFGYEKGAFTGAYVRKIGAFERAKGGTIFLDEMGELSHDTQSMLLRVLEERKIQRLGGSKDIALEGVRVVASTNRDLLDYVRQGKFREDLFYRLDKTVIVLPPLRERGDEDLGALVNHYIGNSAIKVPEWVLAEIKSTGMPGNVRDIINFGIKLYPSSPDGATDKDFRYPIEYMKFISASLNGKLHGREIIHDGGLTGSNGHGPKTYKLRDLVGYFEKEEIEKALSATRGVQEKAAQLLGISTDTLRFKVGDYKIDTMGYRSVGGGDRQYNQIPTDGIKKLRESINEFEKNVIRNVFKQYEMSTRGDQSQAARVLGVRRTTLVMKMKRYGIL